MPNHPHVPTGIRTIFSGILLAAALLLSAFRAGAEDYVWIEGESPSSVEPQSVKPEIAGGPDDVVSGGKWLKLTIEEGKVAATLPETGAIFSYPANISKAGDYDFWVHLGFEKIRAPIDWRIDQGDWKTIAPTDYSVDVRELGVWAPFAWLDAGKIPLTSGDHTVQLRICPRKNNDGKFLPVTFGLDAMCLANGHFQPDGVIKPSDTSWMTDADKAAATNVFEIPLTPGAGQSATSLAGAWQYAGDDEVAVQERLGPVASLPPADSLNWHAIKVPGNRNAVLPKEAYVHRFYMRTRINVPSDLAGRSFILRVPNPSMIATAFVNGTQAGWSKLPLASWDCDITSLVKPGQANEILVAFKDYFYGLAGEDSVKHLPYVPMAFWHFNTGLQLDMPVLGNYVTGFANNEPSLVVAGKVYTSDVFAIPSVEKKTLGLEVTVHNSSSAPVTATLANEIQPLAGGTPEKSFAEKSVTIPPGQDQVVKLSETWPNPKLWWPDDPQQYHVVTRLTVDGKTVDECKTKFGFREWTWNGPDFKLNGMPWHGFADCDTRDIEKLKERGQSMVRVWQTDEKTLAFLDECDAKGMPVRRTGIFDGEGAEGFYNLKRHELWDNYRAQLLAWAKAQRNHPSIFIWSMENEITFINGHCNGQDALTTPEMKKTAEQLMALDPTRPVMVDGGNALLDESLPVYGGHYMEPPLTTLPGGAYDKAGFAHRQVWPVTKDMPILLGEAAFVTGTPLAEHATVVGEPAFLGKSDARPGIARELRMFSEGYRWNGVNFHFWVQGQDPAYYKAWQPVAALFRQWNWTFASGETVARTVGIFNDSRHAEPITLNWNLAIDGKKVGEGNSTHTVASGMSEKFDLTMEMPPVKDRTEAVLAILLSQNGKEVFTDTKAVSVLPTAAAQLKSQGAPAAGKLALLDRDGGVKAFFSSLNIPFTEVTDLSKISAAAKILVVGKDSLDATQATSSQLAGWASSGKVAIVLDQQNELKFQALPGSMAPATNSGSMCFPDDSANPLLAGLQEKDFIDWTPDGIVYRNAWKKPTAGGKAILQCDMKLENSPLVEMGAGEGLLLLSQLNLGANLKSNAVAQHLLLNMLDVADHFKLTFRETFVDADGNPQLAKAVDSIGLKFTPVKGVAAAIAKPGTIAILDGSPVNLKALVADMAKVKALTDAGGWIVLNMVTPDGLADFNKLVGVEHIMRPFGREKVTWPKNRNPLSTGLSAGNISLGNGKQIVNFQAGEWPDEDAFSHVVDLDDIAPFGKSSYFGWGNAVNNFTQADGAWQLIQNIPVAQATIPITLPKPEKIQEITWVSDTNYQGTKKIQVTANGKDYFFDTLPNSEPQTFALPDQPTTSELTVKVVDWTHLPEKMAGEKKDMELVGIDNIYLKVARPPEFFEKVKPFLNIGAIITYPMGKGGLILCNVKYLDTEKNPANALKKQNILSAILHNLHASFSGGKEVIVGGNLVFSPVDISKQANQFRGEQGWFGDKQFTFAALPDGHQTMGGVSYDIYHFTTSAVPEAIMLGGANIPGNLPARVADIPVNRKADALFFLQAARIDRRRNPDEIKKGLKLELAKYIVHYADGKTEEIPVFSEINVDHYKQKSPAALPGAQIAWVRPFEGTDQSAVAYSMQWNNPRPGVEIQSIDLVSGAAKVGVPALLSITAATAK